MGRGFLDDDSAVRRGAGKSDLIDIACVVLMETAKAWRVDAGGEAPVWLPKSQCEVNGDGTVTMPEWLALEKGLI